MIRDTTMRQWYTCWVIDGKPGRRHQNRKKDAVWGKRNLDRHLRGQKRLGEVNSFKVWIERGRCIRGIWPWRQEMTKRRRRRLILRLRKTTR